MTALLDRMASIATMVAALSVVAWVATSLGERPLIATPTTIAPGSASLYAPGEPFELLTGMRAGVPASVLMVVKSDCQYCTASLPFYRELIEVFQHVPRVQFVAVAPSSDVGAKEYLKSNGVSPHVLTFVERSRLKVRGTPTLMIVDDKGAVRFVWEGLLDKSQQGDVVKAVTTLAKG